MGCFLLALSSMTAAGKAKSVEKKMYLFGVAKNYTDSLTYITGIFPLEKVAVNKSTDGVANLEMYSGQLREFFNKQGKLGYICATFFSDKDKDIEKQYLKLKKRMLKAKGMILRVISDTDFKYEYIDPKTIYRNEVNEEEEEK